MKALHTSSSSCGDELHLVVPLTPSGNKIISWSYKQSHSLTIYKRDTVGAVWSAVLMALGLVPAAYGKHWAEKASISIVRCSRSRRAIDDDNLITGCKYARDAVVKAGVVIDDNPGRLRLAMPLEDRPRGHWDGWHGPATHLIIRRIST